MIKTNLFLPRMLLALLFAVLGVAATFGQVSVTIGTLQANESVTITYEATIDANLSPTVTQISSQGTITGSFTTFTT
jgi:hypothetical protein